MLGRCLAGGAALALTGCAVVVGPCRIQQGLACAPGGTMFLLMPSWAIQATGDAVAKIRQVPHAWEQLRPLEGP